MRRTATGTTAVRIACLLLSFSLLLCACSRTTASVPANGFAMGSLISADIYTNEATANTIADTIFKEIAALDSRISATDANSEISALNRGETVELSPETLELLQNTASLCEALGNRIDITLGAVTSLWGFSSDAPRLPGADEIVSALQTRGAQKISYNGNLVALAPGQQLDLGAIGKGEACDIACEVLNSSYVVPAVISFGGTVLCYGQKADGPWKIGIRDPFGSAASCCATYTFTPADEMDCCVISTSGSYEKRFTENGETYHHILDPQTGYPVNNGLVAVTAVGYYGRWSDALSTALFVNGLNEVSLNWIDRYLIGAAFIFEDGGVWVSNGIRDSFLLEDTEHFYFTEYAP